MSSFKDAPTDPRELAEQRWTVYGQVAVSELYLRSGWEARVDRDPSKVRLAVPQL